MSISATRTTALSIHGVDKAFPDRTGNVQALRDVSLAVDDGEFFSIVGPSGCGKSTLLNIIAGLEGEDGGEIRIHRAGTVPRADISSVGEGVSAVPDQTDIQRAATEDRPYREDARSETQSEGTATRATRKSAESRLGRVAYMPQKDLLLPWRTVLENASLGLELTGVPRRTAQTRASELMGRFGLDGFADRYPATLSGGMRQRAAFLRTVLTDKQLMLLDEPFGALDALTRRSMQEWLLDIWSEMRRTVILITHDVEEAILLSDRVAVMSPRPGTIIREISVDLPRPRHLDMVTDPAFVEIKRAVLDALHSGMKESGNAFE